MASAMDREARSAGWSTHVSWEEEWDGDLSGRTGRGRLRITGLGRPGDTLEVVAPDEEPEGADLGRWIPARMESQALVSSPVSDAVFHRVFGNTWRAILASMIAYLIAQWFDIQVFHFWRRVTKGRHLWLRNNGSTIASQLIDTTLVYFVLFIGVWPTSQIWAGIFAGWYFKALIAACDTPLFYAGVWFFHRYDLGLETEETEALLD